MQTALVPLVERAVKVWEGAADCWWGALKIKTVEEAEAILGGDCLWEGKPGKGVAELSPRVWGAEQKTSFSI